MTHARDIADGRGRRRDVLAMTKTELSLLLYLETCAVDHGGLIDLRRVNEEDLGILTRWTDEGLIRSGRVASKSLKKHMKISRELGSRGMWCEMTALAWELAHDERQKRATRMLAARTWKRTEELTAP